MGRKMVRYLICDLCDAEEMESRTDSKGNNIERDTSISEWTIPILIDGDEERIIDRTIDICKSCLKKAATVESYQGPRITNYRFRNEE